MQKVLASCFIFATFSGCDFFDAVGDGLAQIEAENAEQPRFYYGVRATADVSVYQAVITVDGLAYTEAEFELPITQGEVVVTGVSPDGRFVYGEFTEEISGGEQDRGAYLFELATGELALFETGLTAASSHLSNCPPSQREADIAFEIEMARQGVPEDGWAVFQYELIVRDAALDNFASVFGWVSNTTLLVYTEYELALRLTTSSYSEDGFYDIRRGFLRYDLIDGNWVMSAACDVGPTRPLLEPAMALLPLSLSGEGRVQRDGRDLGYQFEPTAPFVPALVSSVIGAY